MTEDEKNQTLRLMFHLQNKIDTNVRYITRQQLLIKTLQDENKGYEQEIAILKDRLEHKSSDV